MSKLSIVVLVAVLVCQGFSNPLIQDGDIAKAAAAGDWTGVQQILKEFADTKISAGLSQSSLASGPKLGALQADEPSYIPATIGGSTIPGTQGRYYSQSEYSYERINNINGQVTTDKGGLGVIDDNGHVTYYKPTGVYAPNAYNSYADSPYGQGE